jgi:hypothetical protein
VEIEEMINLEKEKDCGVGGSDIFCIVFLET